MGHEYELVRGDIYLDRMATVIAAVQGSGKFDLDDQSHVVLKRSGERVAYFGNNTFELVDPKNPKARQFHNDLKRIVSSAIEALSS